MQLLFNDLIGDILAIVIAGVNMVHTRRDSLAKNRDGTGDIAWRAPNPLVAILSGELHGAITHPAYRERGARESKTAAEIRLLDHFRCSLLFKMTLRPVPRSSSRAPRRCADRAHTIERLH